MPVLQPPPPPPLDKDANTRKFRLDRLLETSSQLLEAAREADWTKVTMILHQQASVLKGPDGTLTLQAGPQGLSEEEAKHASVVQSNLAEVQLLLNLERQNTAKRLEMITQVKKIRKAYKPAVNPDPKLTDRKT